MYNLYRFLIYLNEPHRVKAENLVKIAIDSMRLRVYHLKGMDRPTSSCTVLAMERD